LEQWNKRSSILGSADFYGEENEILKTVKNTVSKKGSENNEEPHEAHTDTIIQSLKEFTSIAISTSILMRSDDRIGVRFVDFFNVF